MCAESSIQLYMLYYVKSALRGYTSGWRQVSHPCGGRRGARVRPVGRLRPDPAHTSADSADSVTGSPSSAFLCRRRVGEHDTAAQTRCAQTPAPGTCRCYQPGSNGMLQPAGRTQIDPRMNDPWSLFFVVVFTPTPVWALNPPVTQKHTVSLQKSAGWQMAD